MEFLPNIIFAVLLIATAVVFGKKVAKIRRNILLGRDENRSDNKGERWKTMFKVAIGQSKMTKNPIAGALHIVVYAGFVIINLEVLEIVIDGLFGTHRVLSFLGIGYDILIGSFELLALSVLVACVIFLIRRNILKIKRFYSKEMTSWPKSDANIILVVEILLMTAFLTMNAADSQLQDVGYAGYADHGAFPISGLFSPIMSMFDAGSLVIIERACWWFHIVGILAFLNYLPYSKHFHILLAFPNVFYSKITPKGQFSNMEEVTDQVKLMMDPNADPYAMPAEGEEPPAAFGAKDVPDLSWKSIMDGYTCTECGRCTAECPANQTGKLLSPRKIMMDVRDRAEEIGKGIDQNGKDFKDDKSLLYNYITPEELWACTSCNACTEACPVNNDPLAVIVDLRRFLVMEKSEAPNELNIMFGNVENNGAPWAFPAADRFNWANEQD